MSEREFLAASLPPPLPTTVHYGPLNFCIYCMRTKAEVALSNEHIVPFSLGGHLVLDKASCQDCAKETLAFEGHCAGKMFQAIRLHQNLPTRRPKSRPKTITILQGETPHISRRIDVPALEAPAILGLPILHPPAFFLPPIVRWDEVRVRGADVRTTTEDALDRSNRLALQSGSPAMSLLEFSPVKFARMLAKIGHAFIASHPRGLGALDLFLPKVILGSDPNIGGYVGCWDIPPDFPPLGETETFGLHQLGVGSFPHTGRRVVVARIRLFSYIKPMLPEYFVIVGWAR